MSQEIQVTLQMGCRKDNFIYPLRGRTLKVDQTGEGGGVPGTIDAAITPTQVLFPSITTPGWCQLTNLDDENFVDWGPNTADYIGRMQPGEAAQFRMIPGTELWLEADTAPCKVDVQILED